MLRLSATMGPFSRRSSSSVVLLMNKDGIVFTSRRCGLGEDVISPPDAEKGSLVLGVNEDVKPKQVVVVIETSNAFLDHVVNVFVAAQDGFDHNVLHSVPERFWVFTSFSHPSPQLID